MKVGVAALAERVRSSLFIEPMFFVVGAVVLAEAGIVTDRAIGGGSHDLPLGLTSTVASARAVLSTVAGATITVAGIAFSVSLLTIQLASTQYSPRVVSGLFRDRFNKRVIGIVVGTFTYCLIVLRSVRTSLEQQGDPVIPNVSVAIGVVLGIVSILAVIAFIDHNAHTMDISKILDVVTRDAVEVADDTWSAPGFGRATAAVDLSVLVDGFSVRFDRDGWIQLIDLAALVQAVPEGHTVRVESGVGRYAMCGSPLCTIWPCPPEGDHAGREELARRVRRAVHLGETRTLQQDASYGVRQLADVALRALSPGVNDPTTAQDAIFHLATVLRALLERGEPALQLEHEGRRIVLAQAGDHAQLLGLAYDEIRRAAAPHPTVSIYLLQSMSLLGQSLAPDASRARDLLDVHARLVIDATRRADLSHDDRHQVEVTYARHFSPGTAS